MMILFCCCHPEIVVVGGHGSTIYFLVVFSYLTLQHGDDGGRYLLVGRTRVCMYCRTHRGETLLCFPVYEYLAALHDCPAVLLYLRVGYVSYLVYITTPRSGALVYDTKLYS